jgi:hypothetical protein
LRYLRRRAIHSDRSTTTSLNIIKSLDRGGDNKGSKFGPSEPKKSETTLKTESSGYSLVQAVLRNASSDESWFETHYYLRDGRTFRTSYTKNSDPSTLSVILKQGDYCRHLKPGCPLSSSGRRSGSRHSDSSTTRSLNSVKSLDGLGDHHVLLILDLLIGAEKSEPTVRVSTSGYSLVQTLRRYASSDARASSPLYCRGAKTYGTSYEQSIQ